MLGCTSCKPLPKATPLAPFPILFTYFTKLLQPHDIQAGMVGLLLTRVGDLWHRWHLPVAGLTDATVVAITHCEDGAIRPNTTTRGRLLGHLHVLVEVDPTTSTWQRHKATLAT